MSKEDFELFWRTHLVTSQGGCNVPEESVLYWSVLRDETSAYPWTRREGGSRSQATSGVARDLMTQIRVATKKMVLDVTIFQNYSPCRDCVSDVMKALAMAEEKKIKMNVSMAFVALNRIRRPSWIGRGLCSSFTDVTVNESNDNMIGLRLLQRAGVKLSCFNTETWKFLYVFLGNGLPSTSPGKWLPIKYSGVVGDARTEEDRLMQGDLKDLLKGIQLTSPSFSPDTTVVPVAWQHPVLAMGRVGEYRLAVRKIYIKSKEQDDKLWKIQSAVEGSDVTLKIPGELSTFKLTNLDRDSFYDVTVEGLVRGIAVATGRKIYKTDDKLPVSSLQAASSLKASRIRSASSSSISSLPSSQPSPKPTASPRTVSIDKTVKTIHFQSQGSPASLSVASSLNDITEDFAEEDGNAGSSREKTKEKEVSRLRRSNSLLTSVRLAAGLPATRGSPVRRSNSIQGVNGRARFN